MRLFLLGLSTFVFRPFLSTQHSALSAINHPHMCQKSLSGAFHVHYIHLVYPGCHSGGMNNNTHRHPAFSDRTNNPDCKTQMPANILEYLY